MLAKKIQIKRAHSFLVMLRYESPAIGFKRFLFARLRPFVPQGDKVEC